MEGKALFANCGKQCYTVAGGEPIVSILKRSEAMLHGVIGDERIRSILEMPGLSLQQIADLMTEVTMLNGAPDNVSLVLLSYRA